MVGPEAAGPVAVDQVPALVVASRPPAGRFAGLDLARAPTSPGPTWPRSRRPDSRRPDSRCPPIRRLPVDQVAGLVVVGRAARRGPPISPRAAGLGTIRRLLRGSHERHAIEPAVTAQVIIAALMPAMRPAAV